MLSSILWNLLCVWILTESESGWLTESGFRFQFLIFDLVLEWIWFQISFILIFNFFGKTASVTKAMSVSGCNELLATKKQVHDADSLKENTENV